MSFIISIQQYVQTNSSEHTINTRNKHHLHRPNANLSCFRKVYFMLASKFSAVCHPVRQSSSIARQNWKQP